MTQITICLVLFVAMLVLFFTNKLPMSFTALGAMILLVFTGCLDAKTAVATFGSSTVVTMAAMFVVAAGLSRTPGCSIRSPTALSLRCWRVICW